MQEQQQAPAKLVIQNRRDKSVRVRCSYCQKNIPMKSDFTKIDGKAFHLFCAADSQTVGPCPTCFLIGPCDC